MSCLAKMRAIQEELSPNEKKIARFILDNPALIRDYSSQNLAGSVGVSQSSIVKFSQKLGYRGFTDLKLAIHEAVLRGDDSTRADRHESTIGGNGSISEQLYQLKSQAILSTMELNDDKAVTAAVEAMEQARRIQIVALGAGSIVARNFAGMLIQIGKMVIAEVDSYIQLSSAATLGPEDVMLVISFSGQSAKMLQIVRQAKKAGAKIISLTNFSANPMRSLADIQLYSVSQVGDDEIPQIISTTSQQYIVDLLFSSLVRRSREAKELLARSRQAVEEP